MQILDRHKEDELEIYLEPDEELVWYGIPKRGILFSKSDIFLIPFSLLWGGFAIFWELVVLSSDAPLIFVLWGIPFVLIGIYLIIGRFFYNALARKHTLYAFTRKRAMSLTGIRRKVFRSIHLNELKRLQFLERKDGSGRIHFVVDREPGNTVDSKITALRKPVMTFDHIPDAREVYNKLKDTVG